MRPCLQPDGHSPRRRLWTLICLGLACLGSTALAPPGGMPVSPRALPAPAPGPTPALTPAPVPAGDPLLGIARSDSQVWNGVAVAPDGRVFVAFSRLAGDPGPSLAVLGSDGKTLAYPGGDWNAWSPTAKTDPTQHFIALSAIHLAPDGSLWAVDSGVVGFGKPPLIAAAKLVQIDLAHNRVSRVLVLSPQVLTPRSSIDAIRFDGGHAYVCDAGAPALIVMDLATGIARRLLDGDPSTTAQRPIIVEGETLRGPDARPVLIHADQLEVSPDGKFLYYQPLAGPMFRIPTALLANEHATAREVAAGVEFWYDMPALGGTAIGPDGTLYLDDVENDSLLRLTPDRVLTTLLHDARLHWPAMPALQDGALTIPVAQLDRAALFHHGRSLIRFPLELFRLRVAAAPLPQAAAHR